jgi:FkbM family methyltransferase
LLQQALVQAAAWLAAPLLRRLGRRGDRIIRQCGDHRIALNPDDTIIAWRLMAAGEYQRSNFERALAVLAAAGRLKPGSVMLDIGANIGTHTVYGLLSGHFRRVVALEPEPGNFELLTWNLALNQMAARVTARQAAAGAAAETRRLTLDRYNKGGHSLVAPRPGAGIAVSVLRMDDLLAELGVAAAEVGLAWIDVEGFEPEAVAGMPSVLAAGTPLCLEFNRRSYGPERTAAFVATLGRHYRGFAYLGRGGPGTRPLQELVKARARDVVVF